jgi:ribosomal protein S18 acetylase RimI-like enzyme
VERSAEPGVRPLTESDRDAFWALRLRAVTDHPAAFGWTPEEVCALSGEERDRRFRADWIAGGVMLGAFVDGGLVGTLGLSPEARTKMRHRASIRAVYVAPEHRGRGVAARLLAEAIRRARAMPGVEILVLSVGADNAPARRLYEGFGFAAYGIERRALKLADGGYVDEILMDLRLSG